MRFMAFMVGNVGAGKTKKAKELIKDYQDTVYISLDEIGDEFEKEYGYHDEEKLSNIINRKAFKAIDENKNIIVDGNLLTRENRILKKFKLRAKGVG